MKKAKERRQRQKELRDRTPPLTVSVLVTLDYSLRCVPSHLKQVAADLQIGPGYPDGTMDDLLLLDCVYANVTKAAGMRGTAVLCCPPTTEPEYKELMRKLFVKGHVQLVATPGPFDFNMIFEDVRLKLLDGEQPPACYLMTTLDVVEGWGDGIANLPYLKSVKVLYPDGGSKTIHHGDEEE